MHQPWINGVQAMKFPFGGVDPLRPLRPRVSWVGTKTRAPPGSLASITLNMTRSSFYGRAWFKLACSNTGKLIFNAMAYPICGWPDVARLRCVGPVDRLLRRRPALPDGAPGVIIMFHTRELRCTQTFLGESVGNALPYGGRQIARVSPAGTFACLGAQRWPRSSRPATSAIHCQQILSS